MWPLLWLLLFFVSSCSALVCFNCSDYSGFRSTCSPNTPCTGTRCLIVHLDDAQHFLSTCASTSAEVEDFCWTDEAKRTLCSCRTQFCNTASGGEVLRNSSTNLLPEITIDALLGISSSMTSTSTSPSTSTDSSTSTELPLIVSTLPIPTTTKEAFIHSFFSSLLGFQIVYFLL